MPPQADRNGFFGSCFSFLFPSTYAFALLSSGAFADHEELYPAIRKLILLRMGGKVSCMSHRIVMHRKLLARAVY